MIDHKAAAPLYLQVKEGLEGQIRGGEYREGDKLPSERELCERFGVSRITVRQALEMLENQGLVSTSQGKGTFVKSHTISDSLGKVSSFADTLERMGLHGHTRILSFQPRAAGGDLSMLLADRQGGPPCRLRLAGFLEEEPVVLYDSVIRQDAGEDMYRCAQQLEAAGRPFSSFDLYRALGMAIGRINQRVQAVNADAELAEALGLAERDAVLVLESVIYDASMQILERKKGFYRTDKYSFNLYREL